MSSASSNNNNNNKSNNENSNKKSGSKLSSFLSGGLAGVISRTCVAPLERLKILQQVQFITGHDEKPKYVTQVQALKLIYKEEGMKGYFRGNFSNCIRVFPYTGIQFLSMDLLSNYLKKNKKQEGNNNQLSVFEKQFVGGMSGIFSVLFTCK